MLITNEDSSVELNQEKDDEEPNNGQYQDQEETIEDTGQEGGYDDEETDKDTEERYWGDFWEIKLETEGTFERSS